MHGRQSDGYVPDDMGIGGGDYIRLHICLECGQVQGKFPLGESVAENASVMEAEQQMNMDLKGEPSVPKQEFMYYDLGYPLVNPFPINNTTRS